MSPRRGRWITRYSWPNRLPFAVREKIVPRFSDDYVETAVYIYRSIAEAKAGERQGGSGFIVAVPSEANFEASFSFVVTNRHVVVKAKTPIVRLNRWDGAVEYLSTEESEWFMHPHGDDVAVIPLTLSQKHVEQIRHCCIPLENVSYAPANHRRRCWNW